MFSMSCTFEALWIHSGSEVYRNERWLHVGSYLKVWGYILVHCLMRCGDDDKNVRQSRCS